jgi:hypothetical protein
MLEIAAAVEAVETIKKAVDIVDKLIGSLKLPLKSLHRRLVRSPRPCKPSRTRRRNSLTDATILPCCPSSPRAGRRRPRSAGVCFATHQR